MSTLRRQETTGLGLQRIACAQVEAAIRSLTRQAGQANSAGQAIEQVQAVLALIEPDLPRPTIRRDRAILARLSEGLTELTGSSLLAEHLDRRYKKNPSDAALASAVKALRKRWAARGRGGAAMNSKAGSFNPAIYRLVADMAELRGHIGQWPVQAIASDQPPRGLRRTYTRARKLASEPINAAALQPLAHALTELATQLSVMSKSCPTMVKAQRKIVSRAADELTVLQIDEQLDKALRSELGKAAAKSMPSREPFAKRITQAIGSDLAAALVESPAAFTNRMQAYWSAWRGV